MPVSDPSEAASRRQEIRDDCTATVLAAARRLSEANDAFDDALDRWLSLSELQLCDQQVVQAERDLASAQLNLQNT